MARKPAEQAINELAAKQHGVVGRRQLLREGLTRHLIDHRLQAGRLRALHRGVYQVGPIAAPKAWAMAAVLACGPGALIGG